MIFYKEVEILKGQVEFLDKNKSVIKRTSILKLPIKDKIIIDKTIEMFNEDEPCIIYKTAAINQIGMEILKALENKIDYAVFKKKDLPEIIGNIVDLNDNVEYIVLK